MGKSTEFLKLYEYQESDGQLVFNLDTALNDNWDKVDDFAKQVADSMGQTVTEIEDLDTNKEPRTIKGNITIDNKNWASGSYGDGLKFRKTVPIAGVNSSDTVGFYPSIDSKKIIRDSNVSHIESYNGGVYLYAEKIPSGSLIFDYRIIRG